MEVLDVGTTWKAFRALHRLREDWVIRRAPPLPTVGREIFGARALQ